MAQTLLARRHQQDACFALCLRAGARGAAHDDEKRSSLRAQEWLLIEWPRPEPEPTKYWLLSLPADTALAQLVHTAKMRWRIEHDYHELKQEFGLSHYEGRNWRGFHHHATLLTSRQYRRQTER